MRRFYHPWSFYLLIMFGIQPGYPHIGISIAIYNQPFRHILSTRRIAFIIDIIYIEFRNNSIVTGTYIQPGEPVLFYRAFIFNAEV